MTDGPGDPDARSLREQLARETERRQRAEEAMRTAEQERAAVLDAVAEAVLAFDERFTIIWANRAAAEAARTTPLRLIGRRCHHGFLHRLSKCDGCPAERARQTGQPQEAEVTGRRGARWRARAYPVRDGEGAVVGIVEVLSLVCEPQPASRSSESPPGPDAVGQLARHVGREGNDLLGTIHGDARLLRSAHGPEDRGHQQATHIIEAAGRMAALLRRLHAAAQGPGD